MWACIHTRTHARTLQGLLTPCNLRVALWSMTIRLNKLSEGTFRYFHLISKGIWTWEFVPSTTHLPSYKRRNDLKSYPNFGWHCFLAISKPKGRPLHPQALHFHSHLKSCIWEGKKAQWGRVSTNAIREEWFFLSSIASYPFKRGKQQQAIFLWVSNALRDTYIVTCASNKGIHTLTR